MTKEQLEQLEELVNDSDTLFMYISDTITELAETLNLDDSGILFRISLSREDD